MNERITLRTELETEDLARMIRWMSNENVCRYLNEHQQIAARLKQVYDARLPILTPLFNQDGRFFMICTRRGQTIGFLRMAHSAQNEAELVIAIGEESMWGRGLGRESLCQALQTAFFEMRKEKVVAHIHHENGRSRNLFLGCGFTPCARSAHSTRYQLTLDGFLHPKARRTCEIA